jgi:glycosyltransferase involved in cell wall biosynthesis
MHNKNLYIITDYYEPNTALINRFLAFAKGYGELGVNVQAVFVFPNKNFDKVVEKYENVNFIYLWEKYKIKNRYLKFLICCYYLLLFLLKLKKNDTIILYGLIHFLWVFRLKKSIQLYHERTESPDVVERQYGLIGNMKHKLYLNTCKKTEGLFVISPSLNEYFVREVGIPQNKVHIINMIVDLSRFDRINIYKKTNTIAYCGAISERKDGISYLLKAFAVVLKKHPNYKLNLIGKFANKEVKRDVYHLIKQLKIEKSITLTGEVSSEEMPILLSEAKILALSRPENKQAQYGFPTKLGEYLMTGNPVVITRVGDFDKYLTDKENVIFAKPNDEVDFANKLKWTIENYKQATEIGLKGKNVAKDSFNYKIECQKVIDVVFP